MRGLNFIRKGDVITVKIEDNYYNVYFKKKADITNAKQMEMLRKQLRQKGIFL